MPMESFLSEKAKAKLTEKFGVLANSFDHHVLSILALACDEGAVTNMRLRYSLNLHKSEIANILKLMTQKGLLVSEGYGRGMRYILPQKGPDFLNMATLELNVATSIKKRMSPEELQSLIMTICNEWISLEDLSVKIERNSTYLRNHVIPLMLASRKLQMLYPGTPNHPNQQYKVSD